MSGLEAVNRQSLYFAATQEAARQKAIHDYSEQAVAESYLRVYEECLNQPQR